MAELALVRIDARLIHGQITTQWISRTHAKQIIIIDQQIATDPFMKQIFQMAAPPQATLRSFPPDQAAEEWKKDKFGNVTPAMVLTRNVPQMHKAYFAGFDFVDLLVGGIGGAPGRINVHGPITLNEEDAKMLQEIAERGVKIWFQTTLDRPIAQWAEIKKKYFPKV